MMFRSVVLVLSLAFATGFSVHKCNNIIKKNDVIIKSSLNAQQNEEKGDSSSSCRREFFAKTAAGSMAVAAAGLGVPFLPLESANAITGANKVNAKLRGYVFFLLSFALTVQVQE